MKKLIPILFVLLCAAFQSSAQCTATINNNSTSVCSGDSVYMTASPTGQQSYEWFINGVSQGVSTSAYFLSQSLAAGTYIFTVEIVDNNSCTAMSSPLTIVVDQSPVITLSNNGPLCVGSTLQLSATVTNATSYNWNGPQNFTSSQLNPSIANVQQNQGGWYYLYASNGSCNTMAATNAIVNGNTPTVTASADSGNTCSGGFVMFNVTTTNLTGVTYQWTGPNNFTSTSQYPYFTNVTVADAGIYTCTVTGQGCAGTVTISDTAMLNVGTVPTVNASISGTVCVGSTIQLNGSVSAGTYSWTGPMGFTSTSLNPSIANAQTSHSGNYTLTANNNGCVASDVVYVSVLSNNPTINAITNGLLCTSDSNFLGGSASINVTTAGLSGMSYSWTGPNNFTSTSAYNSLMGGTSADAGTYTVSVTGIGCSGSVTLTDNVYVSGAACDSVWPGDTDNSFDVNNWDVFNIGIAYGSTGTARTGASTNWVAQYAADWTGTFYTNQNYKFADCNGDGVVNGADTVAIGLNYGQWHNKGIHIPQAKSTADPDLYFDMAGVTLTPGATVTVPIKLGTGSVNMQNIYGLAATVKIQGITPSTPMTIATSGWMGDNTNSISFTKANVNTETDWTLVRTNHADISGDGTIALLTFTVPMGSDNQNVVLYFDNVKMINSTGTEITDYNLVDDNSVVYPTKVATISPASNAVIVPNPSDAQANIRFALNAETKLNITITDVTGRVIWSQQQNFAAGQQTIALPNDNIAPGMYNVQLRDEKGAVAQNLKWMKK